MNQEEKKQERKNAFNTQLYDLQSLWLVLVLLFVWFSLLLLLLLLRFSFSTSFSFRVHFHFSLLMRFRSFLRLHFFERSLLIFFVISWHLCAFILRGSPLLVIFFIRRHTSNFSLFSFFVVCGFLFLFSFVATFCHVYCNNGNRRQSKARISWTIPFFQSGAVFISFLFSSLLRFGVYLCVFVYCMSG